MQLVTPFPRDYLEDSYLWHQHSTSAVNGESFTREFYLRAMAEKLSIPQTMSWGVISHKELVGMFIFEPIWRCGELVDGALHVALARRAWGEQVMDAAAKEILPQIFTSNPTLLRVSGHAPSNYAPSIQLMLRCGFTEEGRLRDALRVGGKPRDLVLMGLTRREQNG